MYIIAQICGLITTAATIAAPQFRTKQQILYCNIFINVLEAFNFFILAQTGSAVFLCLVAVVQSFVSLWHLKKQTEVSRGENILFFFLYVGFGLFGMICSEGFVWAITTHNLVQMIPVVGALMLMLSVFAKGEQKTRVYLLLNAVAWTVYAVIIRSTTFFSGAASIVSSAAALWKYRKQE